MSTFLTGRTGTSGGARNSREFNEFAQIEGLGPAMRRWLRESFDVQNLEDLAQLSINRVLSHPTLSQLKEAEKAVCYRKLDGWVKQAQNFVAQKTPWHAFTTYVVSLQARQVGGQVEQRTTAYCLETGRSVTWFGIECNAVYEMMLDQLKQGFQLQPEVPNEMEPEEKYESKSSESGDVTPLGEETASGLAAVAPETKVETELQSQPEPITENVREADCAAEPELIAPEGALPVEVAADVSESISQPTGLVSELSPIILEITEIKVWQPPKLEPAASELEEPEPRKLEPKRSKSKQSRYTEPEPEPEEPEPARIVDLARRSLSGGLQKAKPFDLEVTFQLRGSGAADLTHQQILYHLELYVREHPPGKSVSLGHSEAQMLVEGQLLYTNYFKNLTLRQPGSYRFQIITKLDGGQANPSFVELPFVQVM